MIDDHHQKVALGVVVAFPILGGLAVLMRLWSRGLSRSALTSGMLAPVIDDSIDMILLRLIGIETDNIR